MRFLDRVDAGRVLARLLREFRDKPNTLVLALPRGGVVVAFQIASELGLPLDVLIVRKLGVPGQEELAMGAIASGGALIINRDVVDQFRIPEHSIEFVISREMREIARREQQYGEKLPSSAVAGKTVILVDDGLATGATMKAAVAVMRTCAPQQIVAAVPVGADSVCAELQGEVDQMICAEMPRNLSAVGAWYDNFEEVSDAQVRELLGRMRKLH